MTNQEIITILKAEISHIEEMIYPQDMETTEWVANRVNAIGEAIKIINLHTPKKPNWQGDDRCMDAYCPNCGELLDDDENPCESCSQLIDWTVE